MKRRSDEENSVFVRDEQTGRSLFNARALKVLGIDPAQMQQRGYLLKEEPEALETANRNRRHQASCALGVSPNEQLSCSEMTGIRA